MDMYDGGILFTARMRLWNEDHRAATRTIYYWLYGRNAIWSKLSK